MLKTTYDRLPHKVIKYRQWKNFNQDVFKYELGKNLQLNVETNRQGYASFEDSFVKTLNRHAPIKTKFLRGNNQPFMSKELRKAVMVRSKLRNKARLSQKPEDIAQYKKHRNFVVNLSRRTKKSFFANTVNSPKCFWKAVKPYFGGKNSVSKERILLVEGDSIITNEKKLASTFNNFFNSATDSLNIPDITGLSVAIDDPVSKAILRYSQHSSVLSIKRGAVTNFELHKISEETMIKEIASLNPNKAVSGDIPIKALKAAAFECAHTLTDMFNTTVVDSSIFPDELKLAEIVPAHKKKSTMDKSNYRPISLLPIVSRYLRD